MSEAAFQNGRIAERAAIVAWLRGFDKCPFAADEDFILGDIADAIERGEHIQGGG